MLYSKVGVLDHGHVEVVSHHGCDLTVANAARVSYGKSKEELDDKDKKLIRFLAKNKHWSPFRHCGVTFRIKLPIFIMRQFVKHRIGVEINEMSMRYVDARDLKFYRPFPFRSQSESSKQASMAELPEAHCKDYYKLYSDACEKMLDAYKTLVDAGVAKEQARGVLPTCTYTEAYITMSLQAISNFVALRDKPDAQWEMQQYAVAIRELTAQLFPVSFKELMEAL